ncbi:MULTISPECIES: hypothetical protein [Burkholderia]|uniref:Antitermination protein Q n=1 Tax=Burkholderia glumae TaxID=337 RepID=A0ABY5BFK4_BURGL|nr:MULTISPECIES: hypothetical protein [Burkholderia]MBW5284748.1 hypothetical protein [Burkholderia gladioli]USS45409.1 hypothetical protein NFI99_27930 [Burkholderia glumae]
MSIEMRLENWARVQSSVCSGGTGGSGLVSSIYFPTVRGQSVDSRHDLADAGRVELAMRKLMPMDRQLLVMHYIWRKPTFVICRRLGLKVRPATVFDLAFAHAKRTLVERLSEAQAEYVSMQAVIEAMAKRTLADSK